MGMRITSILFPVIANLHDNYGVRTFLHRISSPRRRTRVLGDGIRVERGFVRQNRGTERVVGARGEVRLSTDFGGAGVHARAECRIEDILMLVFVI